MSPPSSPPKRSAADSLLRALMLGMGTGLTLGGGFLLFAAWRAFTSELDCGRLSPNECALQGEALIFIARRQSLFGAALMTIGLACFLILRARARAEAQPPAPSDSPSSPSSTSGSDS